ncbi:MAG: hypothetical protein A2X12_06440 [Bacteroidetes bacterium GWE2_29_8]|nr:MAG: hypothetical protein A2X12_06440 [Bacteroidetes bacterium GWE2_29_8]
MCYCKKEPKAPIYNNEPAIEDTEKQQRKLFVLNEGLFNMNNSSITLYNIDNKMVQADVFEMQNGRKLGDTGNDMQIYGGKMYVVINVSSQIEVINPKTSKSIKQIPVFNSNKPRQPRRITFHKNRAFVCCFDGTVAVIDTNSLEITQYINVGRNPDGITVANNKLYVCNSGGLSSPNYDNTVSVIDLNTLKEIKKINVAINPYTIKADNYGDVYVISRGNYADVKMRLQIINSNTDELKYTFTEFEALNFTINGDTAYIYYYDFVSGGDSKIMTLNVKNEEILSYNFITDNTEIQTVYGIAIDKITNDVYISDAKGFTSKGIVYCFDQYGKNTSSFKAGLNPSNMVFVNN